MFNSDQEAHMRHLSSLGAENLCWCGWHEKGECPSCPPDKSAADKISTRCPVCQGEAKSYGVGEVMHRAKCPVGKLRSGARANFGDGFNGEFFVIVADELDRVTRENNSLRASLSAAEKERDELKAALNRERQLSDVKCANLAEIGYQNFHSAGATITALTDILAAIRTALGCPELPVEEVAGKVGAVEMENRELNDALKNAHDEVKLLELAVDFAAGEAFTKGAEWMREEAVKVAEEWSRSMAEEIQGISIHPKEGATP